MAEAPATPPSESPVDMTGQWRLDRNENFDEYMKAAGIGLVKRKLINTLSTIVEIKQDGDRFTFVSKTTLGSRTTGFTLGVEYGETNPMWGDKELRVLPEWQGSKLVQRVLLADGDDVPKSFEREIVDGELVITMRRGEVVTKRYFKKV